MNGYAAPQLHTHVVFFNMTERENGEVRAVQPRELYRSQQYGTAIYRAELSLRLKQLGYEIEPSAKGAPEIKGYTQDYLNASSPRSQQIREHLQKEGFDGAEAAQIAAHKTRDSKLETSHEEMQRRHQEMAEQYGHQPARVIEKAQARGQQIEAANEDQKQHGIRQALDYARERNLERDAVTDERTSCGMPLNGQWLRLLWPKCASSLSEKSENTDSLNWSANREQPDGFLPLRR